MPCTQYDTAGASRLARFVALAGVPIDDVAAELRVAPRTLYRWLRGEGRPDVRAAIAIEAWTSGSVQAASWLTLDEAAELLTIGG